MHLFENHIAAIHPHIAIIISGLRRPMDYGRTLWMDTRLSCPPPFSSTFKPLRLQRFFLVHFKILEYEYTYYVFLCACSFFIVFLHYNVAFFNTIRHIHHLLSSSLNPYIIIVRRVYSSQK